ncbi:MAG: S9 family peptidase [Candidatus Poribacteria bacterium]|nr:S9 family peptidase [Candidatus Poribacteria bacterium]
MDKHNQKDKTLKTLQPEDIVALKELGPAVISPDGKWAAFVRTIPILESEKSEHRSHIWLVSTERGEPFQLTNGPNGDNAPQWSPDSQRIAFVSRREGAQNQIWIIPISGGEARQLTHTKSRASNPLWAPDGKRVAFLMEEWDSEAEEKRKKAKADAIVVDKDDFKQTHLWVIDVKTMDDEDELRFALPDEDDDTEDSKNDSAERLTAGDFHVSEPRWSPDGKQIAFVAAPSPKADDTMFNATVQIVDVETKTIRKLTAYDGAEGSPCWSPDGKQIAFSYGPEGYGQKDLHIISADGGASTDLTSRNLDRSVDTPIWSRDGEFIHFLAMDRVRWHLYSVPKGGGEIRQITRGDCVVGGISIADDGDTFLCTRATPNAPGDLAIGSLQVGALKQITTLNPQLESFALSEVRVIQWTSRDGLAIEGLLCLPPDYESGRRYPLIVEPHGGPRSTRDLGFKPEWHYFSGEGFAVFAPNFRGGDGYGHDFATTNFGDWGGSDYQDIMTGVDYLIDQGIADPDRLAVGGSSYGGYMTGWIVTHTDRFKAAIDICGVINMVSMYGQTDIPSFMRLYFGDGAPAEQLELYRERSPINYVDRVKTPTLILHGEEDIRVPLPQSEEFYAGLKAVSVDVEFVKYPREGHGIGEPRHRLDMLKRQVAWYKKYVNRDA